MQIERANELNELGWWSYWARLVWLSSGPYCFHSREFAEPLFNHAGFIDPEAKDGRLLTLAERGYAEDKMASTFFIQSLPQYDRLRSSLSRRGYGITDRLLVLQLAGVVPKPSVDVVCRLVSGEMLDDWCTTYLQAFYGDLSLLKSVLDSTKRALAEGRTKLVLARVGEREAGTLAVYTRQRHSGVYCVGTVPEFRKRGVATAMLHRAAEIAKQAETTMTLQTFASDSVEKFYYERGFKLVYSKDVLVKK